MHRPLNFKYWMLLRSCKRVLRGSGHRLGDCIRGDLSK